MALTGAKRAVCRYYLIQAVSNLTDPPSRSRFYSRSIPNFQEEIGKT